MTEPATSASSMKQGNKYSAKIKTQLEEYYPHKRCTAPAHSISTLSSWSKDNLQQAQPIIPSPEEFGSTMESGYWVPVWITLPEISKACRDLVKCSCKGNCTICKCIKANLNCSPLCTCKCRNSTDSMDL